MLEGIRSSKVAIVFVVALSVFTDTFMYGLIMPVLPYALVRRVGIDPRDLQFWNTTFMASWAAAVLFGSLSFGWVTNLGVSKKWAFIFGQAVLAISTILFMLSKHLPLLTLARILQGASGGAINTLGYTLTFDAVGSEQIGVAVGCVAMSLSLGIFFGPIVGGPLYDAFGYIWVFLPMIILIVIEMVMRFLLIVPEPRDRDAVDERQALLNENSQTEDRVGAGAVAGSPTRARRLSIGDPTDIFHKNVSVSPIWVLLGNRRFIVAMVGLFVGNNFAGAVESTLPVFAYDQLNFSSTQVGTLFLAATVPQFAGPLAGWVVDRLGPKWPTFFGFISGGLALCLLRFTEQDSEARIPLLVILLIIYGCSITLFWGPIIAEVTLAVEHLEKERPGIFGEHGALSLAFGLQNAAFGLGACLGPIYAGAILVKFGWGAMGTVLGVVSLLTAIPVLLYTGGDVSKTLKGNEAPSIAASA